MMILISIFCAFLTGKTSDLSNAVISGTFESIKFITSIIGIMAFWTGIMKVAEKSEITNFLSKCFSPIIKIIFPEINPNGKASKAICMNVVANLLGLGNAATPFGIKAMKELQKSNTINKNTATNSMIIFIVINTASLQLVPTLLCTLRQKYGAENPFDILIYIWITSIISLIFGILSAKIFEKLEVKK